MTPPLSRMSASALKRWLRGWFEVLKFIAGGGEESRAQNRYQDSEKP